MSIPWLWAASCTTGSSGCSKKDLDPGRETAARDALARLVMNEDTVIIKLSLGGLVQVWKAPKFSRTGVGAPGLGMWRRMDHVLQLGPPPMKTTRPCFAAVQRAPYSSGWSISWFPFGPDRRMSTATTMLERCG